MVVTANPHATKAGIEVLRVGGSAVDAAIAIEAVLSLVEPQSSGFGGGGFMVHFDNQSNAVTVYDGRETAPASATADMFLDEEGESIGFLNAKHSGLSTGVPGIVSMLHIAHQDHGRLPWGVHFKRARQLAIDGFAISPRLQSFIKRFRRFIPSTVEQGPLDAYHYFYDGAGEPLPVGHVLKNPEYAATLDSIARDPATFYTGDIATQIVTQTNMAPRAGGMTLKDLAVYAARRHTALCSPYREVLLCGPPPPSSWIAVGMIMGLLERAQTFSSDGDRDPKNWRIFGEAQRLAYADRDRFIADNTVVDVPLEGLLHPDYLRQRAETVSNGTAIEKIAAGNPWQFEDEQQKVAGVDATNDAAGTTHFVVVDANGDVVSLTASVESVFGSARMAGGMFLNNQLTDFSFKSIDDDGTKIANSAAPGKRPRSSMSPTIVLDKNGEFLMATGSPGGNSIIAYTAKSLVGILDWGLSPQEAINLPNMVARGDKVRIEQARASKALVDDLRDFGYDVQESAGENSGLSVVVRQADGRLVGGVDPRREGIVGTVNP